MEISVCVCVFLRMAVTEYQLDRTDMYPGDEVQQ